MSDQLAERVTRLEEKFSTLSKQVEEVITMLKPKNVAESIKIVMELIVLLVAVGGIYMGLIREQPAAAADPDVMQKIIDKSVETAIRRSNAGGSSTVPASLRTMSAEARKP